MNYILIEFVKKNFVFRSMLIQLIKNITIMYPKKKTKQKKIFKYYFNTTFLSVSMKIHLRQSKDSVFVDILVDKKFQTNLSVTNCFNKLKNNK